MYFWLSFFFLHLLFSDAVCKKYPESAPQQISNMIEKELMEEKKEKIEIIKEENKPKHKEQVKIFF